jgi:hypothetical protein
VSIVPRSSVRLINDEKVGINALNEEKELKRRGMKSELYDWLPVLTSWHFVKLATQLDKVVALQV